MNTEKVLTWHNLWTDIYHNATFKFKWKKKLKDGPLILAAFWFKCNEHPAVFDAQNTSVAFWDF